MAAGPSAQTPGFIEIQASDVQVDYASSLLGRGGFGEVRKGLYNENVVAVKMLLRKGLEFGRRDVEDLKKEARRLFEANQHEFIINSYGIILDKSLNALVLEYMHFGHVLQFVNDYKVPIALKVSITEQIISAMLFLHKRKVKHLDLKADNVLVNNHFVAKICDFGLSHLKTITVSATKNLGEQQSCKRRATITHIAPEVLININIPLSFAQDVYAFGITIWEVFSGKTPYEARQNDDLRKTAVKEGQRPAIDMFDKQNCPEHIQQLMQSCWDQSANLRPTFENISAKFEAVYRSVENFDNSIQTAKLSVRQQICQKHSPTDDHYVCTNHFDTETNNTAQTNMQTSSERRRNGGSIMAANRQAPSTQTQSSNSIAVSDHDPENSLPGPSLFSAKVVQNKTDQERTPKPPNPELNLDIQQTAKESHNKTPEKTSPDGLKTPLANMNINDKRLQTPTGGGNQCARKRVNFPNDLELNGATGYTPIPGTQENVEDDDITQLKRAAKQMSNADLQEQSRFRGLQDPAIGNHFARNPNRIVADTNSENDRRFAQLGPGRWSNLQVASQVPRVDVRAEGSNIQDQMFASKMNGTMLTVDQLSATSMAFGQGHGGHSHGGQGQAGGQVPVSTHREQSIEGDMKEGVTVVRPPPEGGSNAGPANQQPQVGIVGGVHADLANQLSQVGNVGGVNAGLANQQPQVGNVGGVNTGLANQQPQVGNVGGVNTGLANQQPQVGNVGGVNTGLANQQPQVGNVSGNNTGLANQKPQVGNVGEVNAGLANQQPHVGNVEIGAENFPSQRNTGGCVSPTVTNNSRYPRQIFGQPVQNPHVVPSTIFGQQMPLVTGYQRPHEYEAVKPDIQDTALPQATGLGANANTVNTRNTIKRTPGQPFQPSNQIPTAPRPAYPPFQPHSMTGGNSPQGSFQSYQLQHPSYCVPVVRPSVTTQNQPGSLQGHARFNPVPQYTSVGPPQLPVYNGTYGTQTDQHVGAPQGPPQNMAGGYRGQQTAQQEPHQTARQTSGPSQNYGTSSSHGDRNNSTAGSSSKKSKPKQTRSQDDIEGGDVPSLEGASMLINHGPGGTQIVSSPNMTVSANIQIGNNNQIVVNEAGDHDIDGASSGDNNESRKKTKCKTSKLSTGGPGPNRTVSANIQIGNNNQIVVNEAGDHDIDGASSGDNNESRKKTKCKTSKLSKSKEKLSQSQVEMVAADTGNHWRKLCRQLGFTEDEVEQLHFDHHHAGLYEMMYQGIRKWQQKNGRQATEKVMARCLWNIDKDDIALRLPTVHD